MMIDMIETAFYVAFNNPWAGEAAPFAIRLFP
jgi:hypothetical protein